MFAVQHTSILPVKYLPLKNIICSIDLNNWHNEINFENNGSIEKDLT